MKRFAIVSGICASFLLGAALSAAAQDEHKDEKQGTVPQDRQENRQDQARPADRQNTERQNQNRERPNMQRPDENRQEPERRNQDHQDQVRQNQERQSIDRQRQEQQNVERQRQEQQNRERQGEARPNENRENGRERYERGRQDQARGERREEDRRRVSDDDFRRHFGREHRFAPGRMQVFEGRPRFFYSGYTFELFDPWPRDWAYDEDDCYVDYVDGGYWLFNYRYPGERVAVMIVE